MNFKHALTRLGSTAFLMATMPVVAFAQDNPFDRANATLNTEVRNAAGIRGTTNIYQIAGRIINVVLGFLGIVLLGYMLYAGFLWMTSGGESEKAEQARTMITNAIIGLIIIVAAFAISTFVLGSLLNISSGT